MGRPLRIGLALQGGGAHGAFAWGVLDRLLDDVAEGRFEIAAISGTSAGALNGAAAALGLQEDAGAAQRSLSQLWECVADAAQVFNPFVAESRLRGIEHGERWNIDRAFAAQISERVRVSPYDLPTYENPLQPVIARALPDLHRLRRAGVPLLFICATRVRDNARTIFASPDITLDVLLASACEPLMFQAIEIDGERYWDGGFMGNPALEPLIKTAGVDDIVIVQINPLIRTDDWPTSIAEITDRMNEVTFNAPLLHELNTIHTVNKILQQSPAPDGGRYRPIRLHRIEDSAFMQTLGVASKLNPYAPFLEALFRAGREAAERWLDEHGAALGRTSTLDVEEKIKPFLRQRMAKAALGAKA